MSWLWQVRRKSIAREFCELLHGHLVVDDRAKPYDPVAATRRAALAEESITSIGHAAFPDRLQPDDLLSPNDDFVLQKLALKPFAQ
jgi:hypothetical protein